MKWSNIIGIVGGIYSLYGIQCCGGIGVQYGGIVRFGGWSVYGFICYRLDREKCKNVNEQKGFMI